jgi:histone acetyltransferase 1
LSDEPQYSSAALCLTLNFLDAPFRPEFTHQCVENEAFRGHQPLKQVLEEAGSNFLQTSSNNSKTEDDDTLLHKSHLGHSSDNKNNTELDVQITLAPSCRKCQVIIHTTQQQQQHQQQQLPQNGDDNNRQAKRQKLGDDTTTPSSVTDTVDTNNNGSTAAAKHNPPFSNAEIRQSISKALPEIFEFSWDEDYLSEPVGSVLTEYSVDDNTFVLALANGDDSQSITQDYHAQIQKLAIWFIENADDVNVGNTQSGFWKVLYLFQKHNPSKYSLVGYITLFHFIAPFHKPTPGVILRICQALVLPPYQGQGHGKRLMQCIYDMIHEKYEKECYYSTQQQQQPIVQVNVEDPAPGFTALRHKVDLQWLTDHPEWWPSDRKNKDITDPTIFFTALSEAQAVETSARAKITPQQVHIVNELQKLQALQHYNDSGDMKEELEKRFRLLVKKRLNKDHAEDMSEHPTKEDKKAYLAKLFEEQYQLYTAILRTKKTANVLALDG